MNDSENTVVPHIDEIDTTRRGWAVDIDKIRKDGQVYGVKTAVNSDEVYFVRAEE